MTECLHVYLSTFYEFEFPVVVLPLMEVVFPVLTLQIKHTLMHASVNKVYGVLGSV